MSRESKGLPVIPIAVGIAVVILMIAIMGVGGMKKGGNTEVDEALQPGIAYLEEREAKDTAEVVQVRKDIYQKKLDAHRDAMVAQLTDGSTDPFSLFKDYAIMGDSRAVGFWYHKFLDKGRVFADGGHTIRNMQKELDQVAALNPSTVYLCYGLNDVSIGYWDTKEEYAAEYLDTIKKLQALLPDAKIVVSSILPTTDVAFLKSGKWRNIPEWSDYLGQVCQENGITFADCDNLFVKYPNLWDPVDGIHFRKEFYPYWASSLIVATLMEEDA